MRGLILVIVAIAILFVAGTAAIDSTFQASGDRFDVEGESWDPVPGQEVELEESNIDVAVYDSRVDVRDNNDRDMIDGTDYEWNSENGTITAIEDGRLDGTGQAEIDYGYSVPTDEQREQIAIWNSIGTIVPGLIIFLMVVLLLLGMAAFARGV